MTWLWDDYVTDHIRSIIWRKRGDAVTGYIKDISLDHYLKTNEYKLLITFDDHMLNSSYYQSVLRAKLYSYGMLQDNVKLIIRGSCIGFTCLNRDTFLTICSAFNDVESTSSKLKGQGLPFIAIYNLLPNNDEKNIIAWWCEDNDRWTRPCLTEKGEAKGKSWRSKGYISAITLDIFNKTNNYELSIRLKLKPDYAKYLFAMLEHCGFSENYGKNGKFTVKNRECNCPEIIFTSLSTGYINFEEISFALTAFECQYPEFANQRIPDSLRIGDFLPGNNTQDKVTSLCNIDRWVNPTLSERGRTRTISWESDKHQFCIHGIMLHQYTQDESNSYVLTMQLRHGFFLQTLTMLKRYGLSKDNGTLSYQCASEVSGYIQVEFRNILSNIINLCAALSRMATQDRSYGLSDEGQVIAALFEIYNLVTDKQNQYQVIDEVNQDSGAHVSHVLSSGGIFAAGPSATIRNSVCEKGNIVALAVNPNINPELVKMGLGLLRK